MRYFSFVAAIVAVISCSMGGVSDWTDGSLPSLYPDMDMASLKSQIDKNPGAWDAAHSFLSREDLDTLSVGTYTITEDGVYAIVSEYDTKPDSRYEAHRKYVDIQYIMSGREYIYTGILEETVSPEEYDPERDIIFFNGLRSSHRHMADSSVIFVFFPSDIHKPSISVAGVEPVRKVVVKIPYTP